MRAVRATAREMADAGDPQISLYDVFLHELGHLQVVNERTKSERLRFAREKCAQEFAERWLRKLWSEHLDHPDLGPQRVPRFACDPD